MKIEIEREDDGRWIADLPDLPGVLVYGMTEAEARNKPQLRISLELFAVEGDGRLPGSESVSDQAGENMDYGVHGRPMA